MPGMPAPHNDDEKALLLAFVAQQRDGIRNAAYGLTDEQIRFTPSASTLSIGGLIKHVTAMERGWIETVQQLPPSGGAEEYGTEFVVQPGETVEGLIAALDEAGAQTEKVIAALSLDDAVPVPKGVPWFPDDIDAWSVRWVLLHLVEEIARHAGHADIVRESIDGATMHPLMAAVEGWPSTPWLQPWQPGA